MDQKQSFFLKSGIKAWLISTLEIQNEHEKTVTHTTCCPSESNFLSISLPDFRIETIITAQKLEFEISKLLPSSVESSYVEIWKTSSRLASEKGEQAGNQHQALAGIIFLAICVLMKNKKLTRRSESGSRRHSGSFSVAPFMQDSTFKLGGEKEMTPSAARALCLTASLSFHQIAGLIPPPTVEICNGKLSWRSSDMNTAKFLASAAYQLCQVQGPMNDDELAKLLCDVHEKFQVYNVVSINPLDTLPVGLAGRFKNIFGPHKIFETASEGVHLALTRNDLLIWKEVNYIGHEVLARIRASKIFPRLNFEVVGLEPNSMFKAKLRFAPLDKTVYKVDGTIGHWDENVIDSKSIENNERWNRGRWWMDHGIKFDFVKVSSKLDSEKLHCIKLTPLVKYIPVLSIFDKANKMIFEKSFPVCTFMARSNFSHNSPISALKSELKMIVAQSAKQAAAKMETAKDGLKKGDKEQEIKETIGETVEECKTTETKKTSGEDKIKTTSGLGTTKSVTE